MLKRYLYSPINRDFLKKWVLKSLDEKEFKDAYEIYKSIREKKKEKNIIKLQTAKKLHNFFAHYRT